MKTPIATVTNVNARQREVLFLICRRCRHEFLSRPKFFFAGLQSSKCPECGKTVVYPLMRGWRIFWWAIAIPTAMAGTWANVALYEGYSWIPNGVGLVSFIALCSDVGVRHQVDRATRVALTATTSEDAELAVPRATAIARPAAATPGYVATLALVIALGTLSSLLGTLVAAGFNRGHETLVVDREKGSPIQEFTGFELVAGDRDICKGGQDYWACTAMHNTMWNALCTGSALDRTPSAQRTCDSLREFIDSAWTRDQNCGYGCETGGGDGAKWGWSNFRISPLTTSIPQPSITHVETCYFALGQIKVGYCPLD